MPIITQQDATIYSLFISVHCSTYFGWYLQPSSGAHVTVSTASGVIKTANATYRERDWTGTSWTWLDGNFMNVTGRELLERDWTGTSWTWLEGNFLNVTGRELHERDWTGTSWTRLDGTFLNVTGRELRERDDGNFVNVTGRELRERDWTGNPVQSHSRQVVVTVLIMPNAVDTVTWAPDDGWRYRPKYAE
jgi:hypothetical protein